MQLTICHFTSALFLSLCILSSSLPVSAQTPQTPQTSQTPQAVRGIEFSICKGETVQLSTLHQPPAVIQILDESAQPSDPRNSLENPSTLVIEPTGPTVDYTCIPPVLAVVPDKDWTLDENGMVVLSPTETTSYKIQYLSADQCPNGRPTNVIINVACNAQNNRMAENFVWLNELINDEGCGISLIDVYERNNSKFIYVEALNAKALYYEDGSVLCTDANLCLGYYNLSIKQSSWSCKKIQENDEAANQIFSSYTWLQKEVDKDNCANETIDIYDTGLYKFVIVYNGLNAYTIFDETGIYSYTSSLSFSYLDDYELFKTHSWACDVNFEVRKPANSSVNSSGFQLFPNPASDKVVLNLNLAKIPFFSKPVISVYTISGQLLIQTKLQEDDLFVHFAELDVSALNKGMYIVGVQSNDTFFYEKLMLE